MPAKKSAAAQALGEAIRSAREERGVAQEAFAAHVGLDRSYYGAIERGKFNITLDTDPEGRSRPRYAPEQPTSPRATLNTLGTHAAAMSASAPATLPTQTPW